MNNIPRPGRSDWPLSPLRSISSPVRNTAIPFVLAACLALAGCLGHPAGVTPVRNFDLKRYLGRWHEIARLDHSFERGLSRVTADYSLNPDGSVAVVNRGYDADRGKWKEARGRALFVQAPDQGYLKVSFFGPFYGSYVVFELSADYGHAFVCGPSTDYLWLLARTPEVDEAVFQRFLTRAREAGFDTRGIIRPDRAPG